MAQDNVIDVAALIESRKIGAYQWAIIAWSCAIMFIEGYDMQVTAYAAPAIIKTWHVSKASFTPIFGFSLFGYMLGAVFLSNLADKIGRKKIIIGGMLAFGVFTIASAYAGTISGLLILRFIAGVGLGASVPTTIAIAAEYAPTRFQATTISVMFIGYTVGATAGGFIAAKTIPAFGWTSVFYIGGIAPLVLGALLTFAFPESVRFLALKPKQSRRVAAVIAKIAPEQPFGPDTRFILREEKHGGLPVKNLFAEGRAVMTLLLWFAFMASLLGHYFLTSWLPTVLVGQGVSLGHAVIATGLLQLGGGVGGLIICRLLDKKGIVPIAIAFAIAVPFVVLLASGGVSFAALATLTFCVGFCLIGGQVGLNAVAGTFYPTYIRSTGAGWALGLGRIGSILGPVLGGILISMNLSYRSLLLTAAIPVLCCAVATYMLGRTPVPGHTDQAPAVS